MSKNKSKASKKTKPMTCWATVQEGRFVDIWPRHSKKQLTYLCGDCGDRVVRVRITEI